jgi:hypothetical protein
MHTLTECPSLNMVYFWTYMKWPQIFSPSGHAHARHPCPVQTNSDSVCKFCHVQPIIRLIFHHKTRKKCKTCRKPKQLSMVPLIGHTRAWKKLRPFHGCQETTCSQTDPLVLPERAPLNMVYFWTYMKWPQLFPPSGHAHVRHPCPVRTNSDTVCKLSHVRTLFDFFCPEKP